MPKKTFFNLNEERKIKIKEACLKEFMDKDYNNACISNIIKNAGISRGSFYQYFEDLEDSYFYLYYETTKDFNNYFVEALKEENNDIIKALGKYGARIEEEMFKEEVYKLYKKKYLNWTTCLQNKFREYLAKNFKNCTRNNLENRKTEKEIERIHIINAVFYDLMKRCFNENWSKEEFSRKYKINLDMIKLMY